MFETLADPLDAAAMSRLVGALGGLRQDVDDEVRIDRIRALEELKSAVGAAQARETAAFAASQRDAQQAAGVPAAHVGRGIAAQIGLARRISPYQTMRYVAWATILTSELPATFAALAAGRTTEWRAMLVARDTVFLSREDRAVVDAELAPRLEALGDRKVEAEARKLGYRLDPVGFVQRSSAAAGDRRVSIRPAPDVMCRLTAFLPAAQGVAAYAALCRDADTLVERVTGQATAGDVPVEVTLVMTDSALLQGHPDTFAEPGASSADATEAGTNAPSNQHPGAGEEPAYLEEFGPVPAQIARRLVFEPSDATPRWLRRLFRDPTSGELIAMDSRRRQFTAAQRRFIRARDRTCRTPWCEAPIRHVDHVRPHQDGGPTSVDNGQGYCVACNHAKQAPGWETTVTAAGAGGHEVLITTPTGRRYSSRAPRPPGAPPARFLNPAPRTALEQRLAELLGAA